MELTILLPCLNEEKTLANVIQEIKDELNKLKVKSEILVIDNGSNDNSLEIAHKFNVRVVKEKQRGYGAALKTGIKSAKGKYIIFGDCDSSYSFKYINSFYQELKKGNDLVIGNRFLGQMEKGAMPFSHKYIGTPLISFLGRKFYKINVNDFNCGLRGLNKGSISKVTFNSNGMEFASEMLIKIKKANLKIEEIPIDFFKDKRGKKSHLNTIRDGIRHMKVIFRELGK